MDLLTAPPTSLLLQWTRAAPNFAVKKGSSYEMSIDVVRKCGIVQILWVINILDLGKA